MLFMSRWKLGRKRFRWGVNTTGLLNCCDLAQSLLLLIKLDIRWLGRFQNSSPLVLLKRVAGISVADIRRASCLQKEFQWRHSKGCDHLTNPRTLKRKHLEYVSSGVFVKTLDLISSKPDLLKSRCRKIVSEHVIKMPHYIIKDYLLKNK